MWSLGRKLPETFGFHVQSDQPSDLHCLSQTNNSYTRNKWSCLLYMPGLGWLPWKSEVYPTRAAPAAWNSCYVSVCGGNFQDGWWHSGSAENKIDLHCMRCMLPVSIWSHWLVWKHMAIKDLALYWEKEKNTRWFQNHPVLSETRLKFESNPSDWVFWLLATLNKSGPMLQPLENYTCEIVRRWRRKPATFVCILFL